MKPSHEDQIEGNVHQIKGFIKEKAGQLIGNPDLQSEGVAENLAGKVQEKIGQVEKVFEKP
jgi:uncharacterized protein YjbJ (UPF0337 family)